MKPKATFYMVMYDITQKRALQKTAKIMEKFGFIRINYSVWLGNNDPVGQPELNEKLEKLLETPENKGTRFYILPVTINTVKKIRKLNGRKPKELDFWVGTRKTMFF